MAKKIKNLNDHLLYLERKIKRMRESRETRTKKLQSLVDEIGALVDDWHNSDYEGDDLERVVSELSALIYRNDERPKK